MRQANRYNFKESEKAAQDLNWIDVISSDRAINSLSSSPIASECNCFPAKQKSNFEIQQMELFKLAPLYLRSSEVKGC